MTDLPDPKEEIPEILKTETWGFARLSRSDDPAVKCLNVVSLVLNLKATFQVAGIWNELVSTNVLGEQIPLSALVDYQILGANTAWNLYSKGQTGEAVECANGVLNVVLPFVYDKRFVTLSKAEFTSHKTSGV